MLGVSTVKLFSVPFPIPVFILCFEKEVTMPSLHLRGRNVWSTYLSVEYRHTLFGILH